MEYQKVLATITKFFKQSTIFQPIESNIECIGLFSAKKFDSLNGFWLYLVVPSSF